MSQRKTSSNNPSDWLMFAEAELEALRLLSSNQTAYWMCRSKCAEVLEKLMKAQLVFLGWPLVKTHDLQQLVDALKNYGSSAEVDLVQPLAEELAECYVVGRYPGFDLDEDEDWASLIHSIDEISRYAERVKESIANQARPQTPYKTASDAE